MKLQSAFLATAVAWVSMVGACGSSTSPPPSTGGSTAAQTGGSSGNGGVTGNGGTGKGGSSSSGGQTGGSSSNGGAGGGASCTPTTSVTPCGGVVTGTWTVASACLTLSGQVNPQDLFALSCPTGQITGTLQVTGTWTAKADGTFVDGTTTTGTEQLSLPSDCKILSKAAVSCDKIGSVMSGGYYNTASCVDSADGGCTCSGTINQTGSMGFVTSNPQTDGNFTTASNTITNTQDSTQYAYCVAGNKLTLTPQGTSPTMTGTIVLQNGSGAGGASGGGGGTGKGGSSGTGGASAGGGASGSGGAKASGGASGSGDASASGGAGGVSASGGKIGSGGTTTGSGGVAATGGSTGGGGSATPGSGPCDIYAAASMPCGAAYSMVRALSSKYTGPLYQVRNGSSATNTGTGGTTKDIMMLPDGYADSASQDAFCTSTCSVSKLYDQSGNGNDLIRGSAGPSGNGTRSANDDYEAVANKISITAGGHKVYALYVQVYGGYRTALGVTGKGIPIGNKDQGIYELVDGTHSGGACCWDFGSVSPDPTKYVTMNTIFFGKGFWGSGAGSAPWFGGDFEGGVWMGGSTGTPGANSSNPSMGVAFALGVLHTPVGKYSLRMADISTASDLTTAYDGAIPAGKTWGNAGGIVMGVGGDNSNNSEGTFFEGAVTNGAPSTATDLLIMKNIQAVGYKK
jgi:non-reducing end alpha-L-arabinofuranosidase